jgi:hypothetical protein
MNKPLKSLLKHFSLKKIVYGRFQVWCKTIWTGFRRSGERFDVQKRSHFVGFPCISGNKKSDSFRIKFYQSDFFSPNLTSMRGEGGGLLAHSLQVLGAISPYTLTRIPLLFGDVQILANSKTFTLSISISRS